MVDLLENSKFISFLDYAVVDNKLYFSNDIFNAYVEVDLETKKVVRMERFEGYPLNTPFLHSGCIVYHDQLFFFSYKNTHIHIVDIKTGRQHMIPAMDVPRGFYTAVIYEEKLYFLPSSRQVKLQRYDEESGTLQSVDWWKTGMEENEVRYCRMEEQWVGFIVATKNYFKIDFSKKLFREERSRNCIYRMDYKKGYIWYVSHRGRDVYCMSVTDYSEKKYSFEEWNSGAWWGSQYVGINAVDRGILLCSGCVDGIYLLDVENEKMERLADLSGCAIYEWIRGEYEVRVRQVGDWLVYTFDKRNLILKIHIQTLQVEYVRINFEEQNMIKRYITDYLYEERVIVSDTISTLDAFLERFFGETDKAL